MMAASRQSLPRLSDLLGDSVALDDALDRTVSAVSMDSRRIERGALFFARQGTKHDAADFIGEAIRAGAGAVVRLGAPEARVGEGGVAEIFVADLMACAGEAAHRYYARPSEAMRVVGITGTNGKTSVSHFIAHGLSVTALSRDAPVGVIGTLGYGLLGQLEPGALTTPDVVDLHRLLAELRAHGSQHVVMEVSSHALAQGRVEGVHFDTAVFTNLSRDHLDFHGDMAAYGSAKGRLFGAKGVKHAVVNVDDAFGRELLAAIPESIQVTACTMETGAPKPTARKPGGIVRGRLLRADREGMQLIIESDFGNGELSVPLLGRFNAHNLLAALGALLANGVTFERAVEALHTTPSVPGRMQRFGLGPGEPLVVVDYAHTPDALEAALGALREHCDGRLWCVFGCGGDRDEGKRPLMSAAAESLADVIVLTDDNPRNEDGDAIIRDMLAGLARASAGGGRLLIERDRAAAIRRAVKRAAADDIVLVAGKGHETYQESLGVRKPFSDAAAVRSALEARRK